MPRSQLQRRPANRGRDDDRQEKAHGRRGSIRSGLYVSRHRARWSPGPGVIRWARVGVERRRKLEVTHMTRYDKQAPILKLLDGGEAPIAGVDVLADVFSLLDDSLSGLSPDDPHLDDLRLVRDLLRPLAWRRVRERHAQALS